MAKSTESDAQRVEGKTAANKAAFLVEFRSVWTVARAAKAAGIHRSTVYQWIADDPEFKTAFEDVDALNVEDAEAKLYELAVKGVEKPVTVAGKRETVIEHDSGLLKLYLQSRRPNVYRDRQSVEHSGPDGGPIRLEGLAAMPLDERKQLLTLVEKAQAPGADG